MEKFNMEEEKHTVKEVIVDLINLIGEAGRNEIYDTDVTNYTVDNKPIQNSTLVAIPGVGQAYHFYDFILTGTLPDGRKLNITTKAKEFDNGLNYRYETEVEISYERNNHTPLQIKFTINGMNYDYFDDCSKFIKVDDDDKDAKDLFSIFDLLETSIDLNIYQNELDQDAVENAWDSLTEDQRKILVKEITTGIRK